MPTESYFQLLHASLKEANREFLANAARVYGAMIIATGWFLAKEDPFPILSAPAYLWSALAWLGFLQVVFVWASVILARQTRTFYVELERIQFAPNVAYRDYLIGNAQLLVSVVVQSAFIWALALMIHERYAAP